MNAVSLYLSFDTFKVGWVRDVKPPIADLKIPYFSFKYIHLNLT